MYEEVNVAAISFRPRKFGFDWNCNKLEEMFREAARNGAQLALAPEGVTEGYVVEALMKGSEPVERMLDVALTMRGATMARFKRLARELKISLAFGCAEMIGREVYNCAVLIDDRGRVRGKYHKMQLAEGQHRSWWFNRLGKKSRAFNTPFGRAGFLICNDRWNEDIARIPVLDGAQYLLIPSFGDRSTRQDRTVLARARENGVPIVEANVGVTLIIDKGEIIAVSRRTTEILYGKISIPARPSSANRDVQEARFLRWRKKEMPLRYRQWMNRAKKAIKTPLRHSNKGRHLLPGEK